MYKRQVQYYENDTWYDVDANSLVSMNMWGFTPKFMEEVEERFPTFLQETVKENPLKSEFYIPVTVDTLIREGKATVTVSVPYTHLDVYNRQVQSHFS